MMHQCFGARTQHERIPLFSLDYFVCHFLSEMGNNAIRMFERMFATAGTTFCALGAPTYVYSVSPFLVISYFIIYYRRYLASSKNNNFENNFENLLFEQTRRR